MIKLTNSIQIPDTFRAIQQETESCGFTMPSEIGLCSLLNTLASSKPNGSFLELGTGTGLSTSWILNGMNNCSSLISIDNDPTLLAIAEKHLGYDSRLTLIETEGEAWVNKNLSKKFDFIFADTWHGKYLLLEEVLEMLKPGGIYIIDDMLAQDNWPEGHEKKVKSLVKILSLRKDLHLTQLNWSSGVIIATKR